MMKFLCLIPALCVAIACTKTQSDNREIIYPAPVAEVNRENLPPNARAPQHNDWWNWF